MQDRINRDARTYAKNVSYTKKKCDILEVTFISQGHNLYKLKNKSLEPIKIADYFKVNNLCTLCLKIVRSRSNLQSKKYNCLTLESSQFQGPCVHISRRCVQSFIAYS